MPRDQLNLEIQRIILALRRSSLLQSTRDLFETLFNVSIDFKPIVRSLPIDIETAPECAFCAYLAEHRPKCLSCLGVNNVNFTSGSSGIAERECFAGVTIVRANVIWDGEAIGYLEGRYLKSDVTDFGFAQCANRILDAGLEVNLHVLEAKWVQMPALDESHYQSYLLLMRVFAQHITENLRSISYTASSRRQGRSSITVRALDYVEKAYLSDVSVGSIAERLGVGISSLSKAFSHDMGITLSEYLSQKKIQYAKSLLRSTDRRISDIAQDAGYASISQFNKVFRSNVGVNPTQFRDHTDAVLVKHH